jgi:hypothetical protein
MPTKRVGYGVGGRRANLLAPRHTTRSVTLPHHPASAKECLGIYPRQTRASNRNGINSLHWESRFGVIERLVYFLSRSEMSVPDAQSIYGFRYPGTGRRGRGHLELPAAETRRWSSHRKAAVVIAVRTGIIARAEASERYALSEEELRAWEIAFQRSGIPGLRSGIRTVMARRPNLARLSPSLAGSGSGSYHRRAAVHRVSTLPGPIMCATGIPCTNK